jgi:hypothetical protein
MPKGKQQVTGKAPPPDHPQSELFPREQALLFPLVALFSSSTATARDKGEPFQLTRTSFCISAVYLFQQIGQTGNGAFTAEIRPSIERDGREIPRLSPH